MAAQGVELSVAGKIGYAIGSENARKNTEMVSDAAGKMDVGAGGKINITATGALLLEILQELAVIGHMRDVERDRAGDKCFEGGFAAEQRSRQAEESNRMGAGQNEKRIDKGIGLDQRAIQVDAQWTHY